MAGALSTLMAADAAERPVRKLAALQTVIDSDLTDGDKLFLMELISTYLPTAELLDRGGAIMQRIEDIELTVFERMRLESQQEVEQALTANSIDELTLPESSADEDENAGSA